MLLCVAMIAVASRGDGRVSLSVSTGVVITPPSANGEVDVTTEDVNAANAKVAADLNALVTERAALKHRGSVPTDEVESDAIVGFMNHYVRTMGEPYESVTGSHSDHAAEADAIIDHANEDNVDVTGKAGATIYQVASDPTAPSSAWLRGSIPNYRAESSYIVSGVDGNYEKELENGPTMSVVSGKAPARQVAYTIIDEAYKDVTSPDCTGVVDKDGIHGVGRGTPPCQGTLAFKKPKNMAGNNALSHIWFNITLDMALGDNVLADLSQRGTTLGACDEALKLKVRSALAQSAGVASSDVIFPSIAVPNTTDDGPGAVDDSGEAALLGAESPATQLQRVDREHAREMLRPRVNGPSLGTEVRKIQGQLASLERHPPANLAAAEAKVLKGDTVFERKLAAAALQLELTQHTLMKKERSTKSADSGSAQYSAEKAWILKKQAAPAKVFRMHRRQLLEVSAAGPETCTFSGYIIVPTADAFDARVNTEKQVCMN